MDHITKEDLRLALAPYATREEMRAEIQTALAPYPTREELRVALAEHPTHDEMRALLAHHPTREEMEVAFTRVPTHEDMYAALRMTRDEMFDMMREEGERTRRHMDVVTESLRDDIRLLAEGQVALHQRINDLRTELKDDIAALDRRVMRLEASRG